MKKNVILGGVLCIVFAFCSCSSDNDSAEIKDPQWNANEQQTFVAANQMGWEAMVAVDETQTVTDNWLLSPVSMYEVMGMLSNGAYGSTLEEIQKIMHSEGARLANLNQAIAQVNRVLPRIDKKVSFHIANSVWQTQATRERMNPDFLKTCRNDYQADNYVRSSLSNDKTRGDINGWCQQQTEGKISQFLTDNLPANTQYALLNAMYFNGSWARPFPKNGTQEGLFTTADGSQVSKQMMEGSFYVPYANTEDFAIAELAYGNGSFCMDLILPTEGVSLPQCIKTLASRGWESTTALLNNVWKPILVQMPKMDMTSRQNLLSLWKRMGLEKAVDKDLCDYSGMASGLTLDFALQSTCLKVDEQGTEAASSTIAGGNLTTDIIRPEVEMRLNRPFLYVIREKTSGMILLIGACQQ